MKLAPLALSFPVLSVALAAPAIAADWITQPSYYTHDQTTGQRVAQYSPIGPFYYYGRPDYLKSGYRHLRSTIQAGGSADNLHIVEQWGAPVIPYEQWRFPFRPFGSPYQDWGPPFGGLGPGGAIIGGPFPFSGGFGPGGFGPGAGGVGPGAGFGAAGVGPGGGGHGFPGYHGPYNFAQPWMDGYYPSYDLNDRSKYYDPYPSPSKFGPGFPPTP